VSTLIANVSMSLDGFIEDPVITAGNGVTHMLHRVRRAEA